LNAAIEGADAIPRATNHHPPIFISYRRSDSAAFVSRFYDLLIETYGEDAIFRDLNSAKPSARLSQTLESGVANCKVFLPVIGPSWNPPSQDDAERSRLFDPDDPVRLEIEAAFKHGVPIVPILVDKAPMPKPAGLPKSIAALPDIIGYSIRHSDPDFRNDARLLFNGIAPLIAGTPAAADQADLELKAKEKKKVRQYYENAIGQVRVLGMTKPISLQQIYTRVKLVDSLKRESVRDATDIVEEIKRVANRTEEEFFATDIVENNECCFFLGGPGSGKSTFLKSFALGYDSAGDSRNKPLPIIIYAAGAKATSTLLRDQIQDVFNASGIDASEERIDYLLKKKRLHLLIDGLDEVRADLRTLILNEIDLVRKNNPGLKIVVTCRTAAYDYWLPGFSVFELAPFSEKESIDFARRWYDGSDRGEELVRQISRNPRILSMCSNPLLATIICVAFDSGVNVSNNRAEIYKEAIETLIKKWDASRDVFRDNPYEEISTKRRFDLLANLALRTFVEGFVAFREPMAAEIVDTFLFSAPELAHLPSASRGEEVLQAIEAQHGLIEKKGKGYWAFAHLTFQEFFVAAFACSRDHEFRARLIERSIDDADWREVILIIASLLPNADEFVIEFLKKISELGFGKFFTNKVKDQVYRAVNAKRFRQETVDEILPENKGDLETSRSLKNRKQALGLVVIEGEHLFQPKEIISLLSNWRREAASRFGNLEISLRTIIDEHSASLSTSISRTIRELQRKEGGPPAIASSRPRSQKYLFSGYQPTPLNVREWLSSYVSGFPSVLIDIEISNLYSISVLRALKDDPGGDEQVQTEEQLQSILSWTGLDILGEHGPIYRKAAALGLPEYDYSILLRTVNLDEIESEPDFEQHLQDWFLELTKFLGVDVSELRKIFNKHIFDVVVSHVNEIVAENENQSAKIRAYVAGELLAGLLESPAYLTPVVRDAALKTLASYIGDLPRPPDPGAPPQSQRRPNLKIA